MTDYREIKTPAQFKKLLDEERKGLGCYGCCKFSFPFLNDEWLIAQLKDEDHPLSGAVFSEDVTFYKTTIDGDIHFSGTTFQKPVIFNSVTFTGSLRASSCSFQDIQFIASPIGKLVLTGNNFSGKFKISQSDLKQSDDRLNEEEVGKIKIGEIGFISNTVASGVLVRFGYLDVDYFYFENMRNPVGSEINIGECNFNKFVLRNLRNSGKFRIYRINTNKTECENFILTDSSLGDSEFQNVNLACYKQSFVANNLLSGLKYTGVQWPRELETEPENSIDKKRETYRNLKNVALENNDAPQAIEFYAGEMQAYKETLSVAKGKEVDEIILWFNRWTNNFGLNWILPVIWIIVSGVILYTLLLWSCSTSIFCGDSWGKIFVFLNPTHKTEFVCEGNWWFPTYFVDWVFRILEGALIYQTIIAFRKFTRKL